MGFAGRTSRRWQRVLGAATAACAAALGGVALAHPKTAAPHVPLGALGLGPGRYGFQARSTWAGGRGCAAPNGARAPCVDFAPNAGGATLPLMPVHPVGCDPARAEFVTGAPHAGKEVAL